MSENDTIPKKSTSQINKAVFFTSALLIFLLVAFAAVFPDVADKNFKLLQQQIFTNASWFYILAVALILLSVTFLGLSRYGDIKLGPGNDSNLLIVFYVQIMPDNFVMQLHRF
ncbi:choline transporter of high affinity [Escherichia coli]|nr:choline transporter of high affinity [Escherichia coli]